MARPGLMLYFDILPALDKLPHAAVGDLLLAALHYAQDGIEPSFEDSSLTFAWAFLRTSVDRDGATYEAKRLKGEWLVYCKQCKRDDVQLLDFDTWRERVDNGTLHTVDVSLQMPTAPKPTTSTTPSPTTNNGDRADKPPAPARDSRNLIFLDDGQFQALVADLGEEEVRRCVSYLSEYCSIHNKKYHDWPTMIRKASREGWGKTSRPGSSGGTDFQLSTDRIQKSNERLDRFFEAQQQKPKEWNLKTTKEPLTKCPNLRDERGLRQEKRRPSASHGVFYHSFEVQGRGRKEAVVLRCL